MGSLIKIIIIDDATILVLFRFFKIGFIHPENAPGKIMGILVGLWRFELQFTLSFWDKHKQGDRGYA